MVYMKYILLIIFSVVQFCCVAQQFVRTHFTDLDEALAQPENARSLCLTDIHSAYKKKYYKKRYDRYCADFRWKADSLLLSYSNYRSHKNPWKYGYNDTLEISIPSNSIKLNTYKSIPDSIIRIRGSFFVLANWYCGDTDFRLLQGNFRIKKIKENKIKLHIYLADISWKSQLVLINNKKILFRKAK